MSEGSNYNCPKCGSDNTASVPLVYKRGHATGTATHREVVGYDVEKTTTTYADGHKETEETNRRPIYGNVTRPTYTITDLAVEVAPPQQPQQPQHPEDPKLGENKGCFLHIVTAIVSWIIVDALFRGLTFILPESISTFFGEGSFLITLIAVGALIHGLLWNIWYVVSGKKRDFEQAKQVYEQEIKIYNEKMREYQKDYAAWNQLYICMRCGHKFYVD